MDYLYCSTQKHTMHFYSGAANHTLRPFLGCLRGLRMNGVPVDLEGKVDESAGIRRNCTGACLNASIPCRNGGQCIDGYASYACDCNNTGFDGYYCHLGELAHICICTCSLSHSCWHKLTWCNTEYRCRLISICKFKVISFHLQLRED